MIPCSSCSFSFQATTATVVTRSTETTASLDSAVPPPDTPTLDLTTALGTTNSTTFNSSEVLSSTTSFETAAGEQYSVLSLELSKLMYVDDNDSLSYLGDDNESCLSVSSSIVPVNFPTRNFALQPTSIDLPLAFKYSIRKAVQRQLKRYAGTLDPNTTREVELGITEAINLAIRILERTHRPQVSATTSHSSTFNDNQSRMFDHFLVLFLK